MVLVRSHAERIVVLLDDISPIRSKPTIPEHPSRPKPANRKEC